MEWKHPTLKRGRISFDLRKGAEIVDGLFEAPDGDPDLETRLRNAGCVPLDEIATETVQETIPNGAPTDDEKRPADDSRPKKERR